MSDAGNPHPSAGPPALPDRPAPQPPPSGIGCVVVPLVVAFAVVVAIIVAVVANAGSGDSSPSGTAGSAGAGSAGADSSTIGAGGAGSDGSDGSVGGGAGSGSAATATAPASGAPPASVRSGPLDAPAGTEFSGPDGAWSITIPAGWTALPDAAVPTWAVAEPVEGFVPNVNVVAQPAAALDLRQYLVASAGSLTGFDVVDRAIVQTRDGERGLLEYRGTPPGTSGELTFLAVVALGDDLVVVATFTAPTATSDAHRADVEPALLSLRFPA